MGLLSSSVAVSRYAVNGDIPGPAAETVARALDKYAIQDIDSMESELAVGWTSFEKPYAPDFSGSSFVIGEYFVFTLRLDKKTIPPKVVKKNLSLEMDKRLAESGREFHSREEKKFAREHVENVLMLRIPAVPTLHDLIWQVEEKRLWLFSTNKAARAELESLFYKSFGATLVPLFPFTLAEVGLNLSPEELDRLTAVAPTVFSE